MGNKTKIQRLLAILDMTEDEQFWDIQKYLSKDLAELYDTQEISLADLAFRFRDEAVKENSRDFHDAIYEVMMKVEGGDKWATAFWGECIAKPIHWIIAVLITKENNGRLQKES